ncbi:MAG: hypothetical protein KAS92_08975, partial [Candidatus Omnitrophica bacterium]|nr:hypothetical protein [Candidatus Omnitrophota bacterium]
MDQVLEEDAEVISGITSEVVREVLIPEIEREVNEGETFANLRQIYNSMILATWYKQNLKESLLGQVYVDQNKTKGVDVEDKQIKEKIYGQYLDAFKKGVYNYIKEDYDPVSQNVIPRKYFSGGFGGEIGKALSEFNIDDISSLRGNREHLVSFLIKVGELTQDEFQDVLSEINMFSSKDQKYIFSQIKNSSLLTDSKIHIAKAILVENAEDGSDGITVVKPVGKASSPVELVEGTQMVKITNKSIEPLTWGTAGARKLIGPDGFNNDNVNRQTAGFAEEILERIAAEKYLQSLSAEKERLERIRTLTYKSINGKNVRVVFAYDSRETSDDFAREMTGVLAAYKGFEVVLIDEALPTPVVARLTQRHRKDAFDFGFHVTASHNQLGWNGLKLLYDGGVNEDTWTKYAEKRANARMAYPAIPDYQPKLEKVSDDILREYLEEIFPGLIEKFAAYKTAHPTTQFTMDLMNGSMATFAQYFERLGFNVIRTKPMKEIDFSGSTYELAGGKKVGFAPDPTQKAFYEDQAEYQDFKTNAPDGSVYALIDGDGDRLVILIKQDGQIVSMTPNQFGPLATDYILTNNLIPELKRIVRTFVTTAGMDAVAKYHDLEAPVIVPVGSKYFNPFKDAAALEESGHFVFPGHFDDTMYQLGLTLTMLVETEKDLFTLLDETQQKIGYKGVDNRDDYENASDELFAKFLVPITGTPEEIRDKSKKIVNEIVRRSGKELLEALVVVVRGDGLAGKVVDIQEYVDSLFTDNPLKIEQSNRGLIVRFTDLSWGGARLSGTANTGRLYTEGRESSEERQQIADAFIDTLGLNDTASSPVQLASRPEGNWETWEMSTLDLTELNVDMFHAYDYLNVGPKVNPLVVWNLGLDWAQSALAKARAAGITNRTVLMAKDARKIEPELEDALVAALRYSGLDVKYIAADGPNAMTSYSGAMQLLKPLMGIFETASHLSTDETIVCGWKVAQMKEIGGAPK